MQNQHLMNTYARQPVAFERGEGCFLWDTKGERYLDALSGIAVCSLGHAHPAIQKAVSEQAGKLVHTSNIYEIPLQTELGNKLYEHSGMENAFITNSGAEANECAIKIARMFGNKKGINDPVIIVTEGSFHGRTLATLTATGNRKIQAGFEPLVQGFVRVPFNDIEAIKNVAKNNRHVVAILIEPIQGEGGINVPADDYLNQVRSLCDEHDWLMMLDEIQSGMCRTGKWFAHQHNAIKPDVMTIAKALANGVPIGACLADGKASHVLQPGNHGSTFGGNPLACAAALATIEQMETNEIAEKAASAGTYLLERFKEQLNDVRGVKVIRGKGLMLGIELDKPCVELVSRAIENKLLINVTAQKVIRLLPPLIMNRDELDLLSDTLSKIIKEFLAE